MVEVDLRISDDMDDNVKLVKQSYEEIIYSGGIFSNTHPDHLYTLGKLHGIDVAHPNNCRVLEIGCAIGSNILPLAMAYPNSEFTGIDLATRHIEEAEELKMQSGLTNVKFINGSISDIYKDLGEFDYIICHGVFSWVPETVQHAIMETCHNNLHPNGMAIISYNCKPGWCSIMPIRDAMNMHAQRFEKPTDKLAQAKSYMQFIFDSMGNKEDPNYKNLQNKYDMFMKGKDYYVYHELLESDNKPLYFTEFMDIAKEHHIKYLCETSPQYMMADNLSPKLLELAKQTNDRVVVEQLHDFITNKQFRSTILVHAEQKISMAWHSDVVTEFSFSLNPRLRKNLKSNEWYLQDKKVGLQSNDENVNKVLDQLNKVRVPANVQTLAKNTGLSVEVVRAFFEKNALMLFARTLMNFHGGELDLPVTDGSKLKTHPLIMACAGKTYMEHVPNLVKMQVPIDGVDKHIIPLLDGSRRKDDILQKLVQSFKDGVLKVDIKQTNAYSEEDQLRAITDDLDNRIKRYLGNGLLMG